MSIKMVQTEAIKASIIKHVINHVLLKYTNGIKLVHVLLKHTNGIKLVSHNIILT